MNEAASQIGYRGYIASRPVLGRRTAQHVQNLVIRDYASRQGLSMRLSATEYMMPGCYMVLNHVISELAGLEGIIAYSMFMLPQRRERRSAIYETVLRLGKSLHFAAEGFRMATVDDRSRLEDVWLVKQAMSSQAARAARAL